MITTNWRWTFRELQETWASMSGPSVAEVSTWHDAMLALQAREQELRANGKWLSGPSDLLSIAGVANDERMHSRIVAWLLSPTGRHALGGSLLEAIFAAGWATPPIASIGSAVVLLEQVQGPRIADIVVIVGSTTLVIENKVWAPESELQTEDTYQLWSEEGRDIRFLLLSREGYPPRQTTSPEAENAWRTLSYRSLLGWLEGRINAEPTLASANLQQYIATLRRIAVASAPFVVGVPGGSIRD
jgi:hypothetical protein